MKFLTVLIFLLFNNPFAVDSTPEIADCEWASWDQVERMRDTSDCTYFYHCIPGQPPFRQRCPHQEYGEGFYQLYYNPNTTVCDYSHNAPPECFGLPGDGGGGDGGVIVDPVITTTEAATTVTTEPPTTTTTTPPRPPLLDDEFEFEIDCSRTQCGLFPNTYGECNTYVICVDGVKIVKNCNGGQLFDVRTKECQPASRAQCWTEPNAGPHLYRKGGQCPFHGYQETRPIEEKPDGSVILQNPVVTNWGDWQRWEECPSGMYATGLYAWRRVLSSTRLGQDHIGIYSMSFTCQSPGGNETTSVIQSIAPGGPPERFPFYYMCTGAVVGFQLNSVKQRAFRVGDEIATDNVLGYCSCSRPVYKPYEQAIYAPQSGHRGDWTASQYCKKYQAVCGMQTQMQRYREYAIGQYDNTGLNNLKIKCCNVPNPMDNCVPAEERLHIRDCDNSNSDEGLRCNFDSMVGLTMDYNNQEKIINFYSSVGYDMDNYRDEMKDKIITKLEEEITRGASLEYSWEDVMPPVEQDETITPKSMYVRPFEKLELYQIVGKCDYFLVKSNRYVRVIKNAAGAVQFETYFEV